MTSQQASPISQMLYTLGLTREDLSRRSNEMRQFLTSQGSPTLRVADRDHARRSSSSSDLRPPSRSVDSRSSFARSTSRSCSTSLRDPSPPTTPVKTEPPETIASLKHYDSMEVVIERQRRQNKRDKRAKRDKERELTIPQPTSPSPSTASHASLNLDSFMYSRDDRRVSPADFNNNSQDVDEPVTPQKRRYYREHTHLSSSALARKEGELHPKAETITATRLHNDTMPPAQRTNDSQNPCYPFASDRYAELSSTSQIPVTPQKQRGPTARGTDAYGFPSSSPPASSPLSSPSHPVVNLVSSPGPMGPPPQEDEYDELPYRLPPGPYSPKKPDLSYAALVGQAILSSPEHRLTLQEIYDWITIVYPHYKRGETTWMNSIRHVLSTTVCFRKVPRDRSVGRTLWAIWDEDLECFKGGGFRKHLCKDIVKAAQSSASAKGKGKARKRIEGEDDSTPDTRKSKKSKKAVTTTQALTSRTSYNAPPPLSHPLFPPTRPTPHHQPYYESCIMQPQPQPLPAEIIFPPLPPTAYSRFHNAPSGSPEQASARNSLKESPTLMHSDLAAPPSDASSMLSVPELTPNRSSSSPPPSLPLTSEVDLDDYLHMDQAMQRDRENNYDGQRISMSDGTSEADTSTSLDGETDVGDDVLYGATTLGPVHYWGETPKHRKLKRQQHEELLKTGNLQKGMNRLFSPTPQPKSSIKPGTPIDDRPTTPTRPPTPPLPITPPRNTSIQISSVRTPLSHKGLHMSPSSSLAHYKSNLDPPPVLTYVAEVEEMKTEIDDTSDEMRTPRRPTAILAPPVTPKRPYLTATDSSRTPLGGPVVSPFRTPGSRSIFDPQDPGTLLDEELNRAAAGQDDSPVGLFGKGRPSLLYDSPGALGSPGKWFKWW
ncbi:hypothetical protein APHAL10511_004441 [Amanita phalloides]|nr:hypothetical protein APHAL10511_004441 [Amanita phalloides]